MESVSYKVEIYPSYEWQKDAKDAGISHRELEIFSLVIKGYRYKEIANVVDIQPQSVRNHMQRLLTKLGAKNGSQALVLAISKKLINVEYGNNLLP
ncbi:response regulator transcription factor [Chloroflexota bacterium]